MKRSRPLVYLTPKAHEEAEESGAVHQRCMTLVEEDIFTWSWLRQNPDEAGEDDFDWPFAEDALHRLTHRRRKQRWLRRSCAAATHRRA